MGVKTIDLKKKKVTLDSLLEQARAGVEVLLVEGGVPVARLTPERKPARQRVAGLFKGKIWMSDDFDDPLPDEFWLGEEE